MVPGVDDYNKLACEVWASFGLPNRVSKLCQVKNDHQALPAPLCVHWKNFLLLPDSIFACWDIWEIQWEKMVAYAQALQFWAEKADLPTGGRPCQLVGSIRALGRDEMLPVLSDEDVFKDIGLPEETPIPPTKEAAPQSAKSIPASTPVEEATMEMTMEPAMGERPPNKFPGWEKVLHPSKPKVAAGQIPSLSRGPRLRPHSWSSGGGMVQTPQIEEPGVMSTQPESPQPTKELGIVWQVMLPPGFPGVTVCLWRDQLMEGIFKVPQDPLTIEVISVHAVAMMSASHIMRDEVTGVTYMDTVTTSVGRVTLSSPEQETSAQGPMIQDVTDLV